MINQSYVINIQSPPRMVQSYIEKPLIHSLSPIRYDQRNTVIKQIQKIPNINLTNSQLTLDEISQQMKNQRTSGRRNQSNTNNSFILDKSFQNYDSDFKQQTQNLIQELYEEINQIKEKLLLKDQLINMQKSELLKLKGVSQLKEIDKERVVEENIQLRKENYQLQLNFTNLEKKMQLSVSKNQEKILNYDKQANYLNQLKEEFQQYRTKYETFEEDFRLEKQSLNDIIINLQKEIDLKEQQINSQNQQQNQMQVDDHLSNDIEDRQSMISGFTNQVQSFSMQIQIGEKLALFDEEIQSYVKGISKYIEGKRRIAHKLSSQDKKFFEQLETIFLNLKEKIFKLDKEFKETVKKYDSQTEQVKTTLIKTLYGVQQLKTKAEKGLNTAEKEAQDFKDKNKELQERLEISEKKNVNLGQENQLKIKQVQSLEDQVDKQQKELRKVQQVREDLSKDQNLMKKQLEKQAQQEIQNKKQIEGQLREIMELSSLNEQLQRQNQILNEDLERIKKESSQLQKEKFEKDKILISQEFEIKNLRSELQGQQNTSQNQTKEISSKLGNYENLIRDHQRQIHVIEQNEQQFIKLNEQINQLNAQIDKLNNQLTTTLKENNLISNQNEALSKNLIDFQNDLVQVTQMAEKYKNKKKMYKQQKKEAEEHLDQIENKIPFAIIEIEDIQNKLKILEEENKELKEKNDQMKYVLELGEQQINKLEEQNFKQIENFEKERIILMSNYSQKTNSYEQHIIELSEQLRMKEDQIQQMKISNNYIKEVNQFFNEDQVLNDRSNFNQVENNNDQEIIKQQAKKIKVLAIELDNQMKQFKQVKDQHKKLKDLITPYIKTTILDQQEQDIINVQFQICNCCNKLINNQNK